MYIEKNIPVGPWRQIRDSGASGKTFCQTHLSGALGSQAGKDAAVTCMGQGTQAALANNQNTLSAAAQNYSNQADTAKNIAEEDYCI